MSKKNVIARVGNFEITKESHPEHDYLRIKSISGHWGVTYRDDNEMFGKVLAMCKGKEQAEHLHLYVLHLYHTTTIIIDEEFALDFMIAIEAMRDRMIAATPPPTEQEEEEAIKEMEVLEDAKKLLEDGR